MKSEMFIWLVVIIDKYFRIEPQLILISFIDYFKPLEIIAVGTY